MAKADFPMYGQLLQPNAPMGAPPAVKGPLPPAPGAQPMPPTPQPSAGPTPGLPSAPPDPKAQMQSEIAARLAYQQQHENFLHALAMDYGTGKISADDLKKGASYTGVQPYHEWKHENVTHLKEAAKASQ